MNIHLVEVMVQTSEHKRLLIIKSLHTNNNDYYNIWKIQFAGSTNMKETTFQYSYIKAKITWTVFRFSGLIQWTFGI